MQRQAQRGLLKGMNPRVTLVTFVVVTVSLFYGTFYTERLGQGLALARGVLDPFLEWYYVLLVAFLLLFMVWLGMGRYKNVRLGGDFEQPEFSFFSWVAMLFAAGTGVGILFWSVAQPILQFQDNPFIEQGMSPDAARVAMRLTYFHWGLNGWAIFSFVALVLAYFSYRWNLPLTIRSALTPLLGRRTEGVLGDVVDVLAVFGTVFGIATTLGLGVQQMNAGLEAVFGLQSSLLLQLVVTAVIMTIATLSVVSGVKRGVRLLSEANFWLSIAAVLFLLLFGPTQYLVAITIESAGDYIQNLMGMTFHTNATRGDAWQSEWTVFFWGWWLAWSPFVGMFIARVSRGRTFREFVMGVLLVPTVITIVWIGLFGGTALYHELFGNGGIVAAVDSNIATAVFATIEAMELGLLGRGFSAMLVLLIATYLITSANAGTLVINTILAGGDPEPPTAHRLLWGGLLGLLTAVLLMAGGLETLQAAVIMAALPFSVVVMLMVAGLLKALHRERYAARTGERVEAPREPWADLEDAGTQPSPVSDDETHKLH
ncbi:MULTISPECIES: BCCT family transporter [Halomonadaceae]|jgi:choline/glycine/proline betaine transport protein|uniref:BCCT family transporter n=1 Tax=Billgrantia aerodenitrificans TaxID=2733483 RepID=A0ABS9AT32_9GAMM|nr:MULTISPECIES: BCCT family transporter [Halomonas]MCE8024842.1 BCCT family transporter [Halomonas aerodenitrificans]MCE8038978.1 BCCT family transporter [Halomonas sp. MCCC 1A11062]